MLVGLRRKPFHCLLLIYVLSLRNCIKDKRCEGAAHPGSERHWNVQCLRPQRPSERREMTGSGAEMWSWDEHSKASVYISCTPRTSLWLDSDVPDTQPDEPGQRHIGSKASFIDRLRRTVPQLCLPVFTFISINTYRCEKPPIAERRQIVKCNSDIEFIFIETAIGRKILARLLNM